jgi:hypothetical protein
MDSTLYKEEIAALKVRQAGDAEVLSAAESSYSDPRIRRLCSESAIPLDETIRVLSECTPFGELSPDKLAAAVESIRLLEEAVKHDPALVDYYKKQVKEDRALPIFGVEEIVMIVVSAFLNGAFSEIAKSLLQKLLKGSPAQSKDIKKAMELLLSNSLLPVLEADEDGLTASQIARKLGMKPEEAGYFLAKYEERGWVKQARQGNQLLWKLKKSRAAIIDELTR